TEVSPDYVRQNIVARRLRRLGRIVDVAGTVLAVLDQILLAQNAEHRSHRRIRGWIGKVGHYLGDCRAGTAVEDVHNLSLSTRECGWCFVWFVRHQRSSHWFARGSRTSASVRGMLKNQLC